MIKRTDNAPTEQARRLINHPLINEFYAEKNILESIFQYIEKEL